MQTRPDFSTQELTRTQLKLRGDLRFVPQQYGGETWYHIEVTGAGEYYRMGYAEYCFVSLLDGQTSFAQALALSAQALGTKGLTQIQAEAVYSWLLDRGLGVLTGDHSESAASPRRSASARTQNLPGRFNPLWVRIPLGRPEAFLKTVQPWLGWLFSGAVTVISCLLMVVSTGLVASQWDRFSLAAEAVFAPNNWMWLLLAWTALKVIHEVAHGLVCLRYGGEIRSMGIVLAFLAPLPFVDASSCWAFRQRRHRIHVALAGIYIELLLAAIAGIWWSQTESRVISHLLHSVIMMASLSTLVFNLNPLMRFDGYFVLSDALNIPNLYSEAGTQLTQTFRQLVFGDSPPVPSIAGQRRYVLLSYGLAALAWRLSVCITLLIAASVLFHGAGIALAAGGFVAWFAAPLWRACCSVRKMAVQAPVSLLRGAVVMGMVGSLTGVLLFAVPAPMAKTAPGVVDYQDGQVVRAVTSGFVRAIHVDHGDTVESGDLLMELVNDEFETELKDLQLQVHQEELRLQTATRDYNAAGISIARANLESLRHRQQQTQKRVDGLKLVAGTAGRVSGRQLRQLEGTFVKAGDELLTIGREQHKELQCSVGQMELSSALGRIDQSVAVRIGTRPVIQGTLLRVNPRATRDLPHPALAATQGGTLAVVEDRKEARGTESGGNLRLTDHRFDAVVRISPQDARQLQCGERGQVALGLPEGPLAVQLYYSTHRWLQSRLDHAQAAR